ncbi:MAG: hypothetical protein ACK4E3_08440 [Brevundimonas sp.]|jgi:hypothetical protein|uniref:hypothetical protein n=1 Tax=Brevundimonas sp. TaxID=1871086 RepID=UPI003918A6A9
MAGIEASTLLMGGGLAGAFAAALLHAGLPTHWLPFVLVGRGQGWSAARILGVTAVAATAHIASTALIGSLIALIGVALDHLIDGLLPMLTAALLAGFGLVYLWRGLGARRKRRVEADAGAGDRPGPRRVSDLAAMAGLIGMMVLSPGEVLLPLYLQAGAAGAQAIVLLTVALWLGTLAGMVAFTALALGGVSALRLERLARHEALVLGVALIALAAFVLLHHP